MTEKQIERNLALAAALESGEYKQTQGYLRDEGFCCLGVACDLYRKATKKGRWVSEEEDWPVQYFRVNGNTESSFPPKEVAKYFGWFNEAAPTETMKIQPELKINKEVALASLWNDERGKNFKVIARGFRRLANDARRTNEKAARKTAAK